MKRNWKLLRSSNLEKSIGTRWWSTDWCTEGDAVFNRKSPKLLEKQQHEGEKTVLFLDIFICREGDISTPLFSFLMACFEVIHVEADRSDLTSAVAQRKKKKIKIGSEWKKESERNRPGGGCGGGAVQFWEGAAQFCGGPGYGGGGAM